MSIRQAHFTERRTYYGLDLCTSQPSRGIRVSVVSGYQGIIVLHFTLGCQGVTLRFHDRAASPAM